MTGFEYPSQPHSRTHGPQGYASYESYRDWLRDEFLFRCVYCLHRERWYSRGATFHIDHFMPASVDATGICSYDNLVYACASCNEAKKAILGIADPCETSFSACLQINVNGHVIALNAAGEKLKEVLLLDSRTNVEHRSRWMRMLRALQQTHPSLYEEFMAYPTDLPDLRKKRTSSNTRPKGALSCCFVLRERASLPAIY